MSDTCPFCKCWNLIINYFEDDWGYFCPDCGREWLAGEEENYGWGEPELDNLEQM